MKKRLFLLSLVISALTYGQQDFFEEEKGVKLEETVISTTGFEDKARNNLSNVIIITEEDIKKKNLKSVKEVLQYEASVTIVNGAPDLRGRGTERGRYNTKILIDGISINEMDPFNVVQIEMIPIEEIERIEVISGGGSVVYGDGASGGVINIITKKKSDKVGTTTSFGTETASYNTTRNFLNVTGGNEKLTAKLSYNDYETDGYRENMDKEEKSISASLRYDFSKDHNLTIKHTNYKTKYNGTTPLLKAQVDEDRKQGTIIREFDIDRSDISLIYNNMITDKLNFKLSFLDSETDKYLFGRGIHTGRRGAKAGMDFDADKRVISPKILYRYGKDNQFVVGYDYEKDASIQNARKEAAVQIKTDYEKETNSIFALNRINYGKFEFTQGIRLEKADYNLKDTGIRNFDISTDKDNKAYEIGINYLYSDTGNIYLRYEKGYVSPTIDQLIEVKRDGSNVANDRVESEVADSFEIGFKDYIAGSYISATAFYSKTTDELAVAQDVDRATRTLLYRYFYNLDKTERKGIELAAEQYFNKFKFNQSITYIDATIESGTNAGNKIPGVSDIKASFGIRYQFSDSFDMGANIVYQSAHHIDEANKLEKYNKKTLVDLTANYRFNSGFKIYGGVNNIFGQKYYEAIYDWGSDPFFEPAEERYFYLGASYKF